MGGSKGKSNSPVFSTFVGYMLFAGACARYKTLIRPLFPLPSNLTFS